MPTQSILHIPKSITIQKKLTNLSSNVQCYIELECRNLQLLALKILIRLDLGLTGCAKVRDKVGYYPNHPKFGRRKAPPALTHSDFKGPQIEEDGMLGALRVEDD